MNYKTALERMEHLRDLVDQLAAAPTVEGRQPISREIYERYGELEDIYKKFAGGRRVQVPDGKLSTEFDNYFEAGYLSKFTYHMHEGYTELNRVIGALRRVASEAPEPRDERTIGVVIETLQRFRPCCEYVEAPPVDERAVQDIIWIMLRSRFDRLDREDTLPKFGAKGYRPDFGIPELKLLVEVKFIGDATKPANIQEELLADVPGYLSEQSRYDSLLIIVYDGAQKLRDSRKFVEDLRTVSGIVDVIVIPGIG